MARNKVDTTNTIECESPSLQPVAEFPRGEIDKSETSVTTPEKAVAEFVKHRSASAYEGVLSTVAASRGIEAFKNDPAKLQDWLNNMVRVKALSKTEASEGLNEQKKSNSNITKLRKIAESSSILTDPKVMSLLPSGSYTVMYECYRLHKVLADLNPETAVAELVKILEGHDGPLTRAWLEKQREKLKPAKVENADVAAVRTDGAAEGSETSAFLAEDHGKQDSAAVTATPVNITQNRDTAKADAIRGASAKQQALPDQDHDTDDVGTHNADEEQMEEESIAAVVMIITNEQPSKRDLVEIGKVADKLDEDGVLIVCGSLAILLSTGNDLEPFGLKRCHKVYLQEPSGYDVSDCLAVIVYTRSVGSADGDIRDWNPDPASLADQILSSVGGRKVLLFGSTEADGWEAIARQGTS